MLKIDMDRLVRTKVSCRRECEATKHAGRAGDVYWRWYWIDRAVDAARFGDLGAYEQAMEGFRSANGSLAN